MRVKGRFPKDSAALAIAIAGAAFFGCYTGPALDHPSSSAPSDAGPAVTNVSGLPCDVAALLTTYCVDCHSIPPRGGARSSLVSREALLAPWEGSSSLAQASLDRMRDAARPMPPDGLLSESDVAALDQWIAAGMPAGSCGAVDAGGSPVAVQCTSGTFWTKDDDDGSKLMAPGRACMTCHEIERSDETKDGDDDDDDDHDDDDVPLFTIAGTLYPSLHEPDNCYGHGDGDAQVVIEGADGNVLTLDVNRAGNFMTETLVALPYRAKVVRGGKEIAMQASQTSGDCNTCHSSAGTSDAAGRITMP
jgi:cytochrome c553